METSQNSTWHTSSLRSEVGALIRNANLFHHWVKQEQDFLQIAKVMDEVKISLGNNNLITKVREEIYKY